MIFIVVLLCSLLVLPEVVGCHMYHVLSGSMEPYLPVSYDQYIGSVILALPYLGVVMTLLTSLYGKLAAAAAVLLGVVLNLAGSLWERHAQKKEP